jgi:hypothetical protein
MGFTDMNNLNPDKTRHTESKPVRGFTQIMFIIVLICSVVVSTLTVVVVNRDSINAAIVYNNEHPDRFQTNDSTVMGPQAMHWWLFTARR